ncbi:glycosyltransferase [Pseudolysinimonas sp.]|uniref:glycosyltransferase n=1 Tax=Pseudolysinimonas sp. TaxID=2680009 RepID=UPI00286ACC1C|nr:glycosyltransferase [Pseudolysinimonas sp.]
MNTLASALALPVASALAPSFRHLRRMTTGIGVFEHALNDVPRVEHGYCVDDVARALTVVVREPDQTPELAQLTDTYLSFLEAAVAPDGLVHNRMDADGQWADEATVGDWWGRAVGALGFAAAHSVLPFHRTRAMYAFLRAAARRSPDVRASAFAALGAVEVLSVRSDADAARALLVACLDVIPTAPLGAWDWPEARLRYANATLCEALIAGGGVLGRRDLVARGLALLSFLLRTEEGPGGRLSLTGSAGRGPGESGPLWDQQAIEAAALADACARAFHETLDPLWRGGVQIAWAWFLGENDSATPMYDPVTGAGFDGLEPAGRNANRGAESTLAALDTLQHARALGVA